MSKPVEKQAEFTQVPPIKLSIESIKINFSLAELFLPEQTWKIAVKSTQKRMKTR